MVKIDELVRELARAKAELEAIGQEMKEVETQWKEESGWNKLDQKAKDIALKLAIADERIRKFALRSYAQTGRAKIHPNVFVQLRPKADYQDEQVIRWAIESERLDMLRPDKRRFNKLALVSPPSFVTVERRPIVVVKGVT